MMLARQNLTHSPFDIFRQNFDRLFTNALEPFDGGVFNGFGTPALNIWDEGEAIVAEAELPGIKLEDIEVLVVGDELTIKGRRTIESQPNATIHRQERATGEFARVVTLPAHIDAGRVEATLKDGVLTVRMPKAEESKARKIAVKGV